MLEVLPCSVLTCNVALIWAYTNLSWSLVFSMYTFIVRCNVFFPLNFRRTERDAPESVLSKFLFGALNVFWHSTERLRVQSKWSAGYVDQSHPFQTANRKCWLCLRHLALYSNNTWNRRLRRSNCWQAAPREAPRWSWTSVVLLPDLNVFVNIRKVVNWLLSPLRSVTEHIRLQQRTEKQQLLRVPFCLSVSKICRGCHNKIKINLFSPHIIMDSTCGGRGSVVNAMSSHLFLLDFFKVRCCLLGEQRLHLRRRCELACKK